VVRLPDRVLSPAESQLRQVSNPQTVR
jgi:hypothetical protein